MRVPTEDSIGFLLGIHRNGLLKRSNLRAFRRPRFEDLIVNMGRVEEAYGVLLTSQKPRMGPNLRSES